MSKPSLLLTGLILAALFWLPSAQSTPAQVHGDFVSVKGNQLIYRGSPVKLKGVNFYPKDQPWGNMWNRWDGEATRQDLARAQELGINSVRVLVPYDPDSGWTDKETGEINPVYLKELQQLIQMAGDMNLKVIVALFDFYDPTEDNPDPGSAAEARNKQYLQALIPVFVNDDRVLAWDLHNEPDQYPTWRDNNDPAAMVNWLDRMASEVRRLDSNHPLTVGMWQFDNLFVADKSGSPPVGRHLA